MLNPTFTATDDAGRSISLRDRKRRLWALSVVYPLIPFTGIAGHWLSGHALWLVLPLVIGYLGGPLLDVWLGEDQSNPPEAVVPQLEADRYYRWLTYAVVPLHFLALIGCAVWAATQDLPAWAFFVLAYVAGTPSGLGINTGHELGHKHTALEVWLAKLVLAVPAYGHFRIEHNRGHHRFVATPEDHHANAARRYQALRHFPGLPQLPSGYFGMFPLAYVPSLWFKVMDPRLLALPHIRGDFSRINLDPARGGALRARYGVVASARP